MIGKRVERYRLEKGLTREALAAAVGTSVKYLYLIESGRRPNPGAEMLCRIALALGVPMEHLCRDQPATEALVATH